ncbi:MAG TPA: IPT/TIG domain-containing protein, partial [Pyrinomonadaceae bacterium]
MAWLVAAQGTLSAVASSRAPRPAAAQAAETLTVFGPERFTRQPGPPAAVTRQFSLPAGAAAPFRVQVQNGAGDGSNRVSSATVLLNGVELLRPQDFNQNVAVVNRDVTLAATNTLEVTVKSAPGSHLTVTFTATRAAELPPPSLESVGTSRAVQGQTLQVALQGKNTNWAQGQTRASFGGEVSVGGAPNGEPGLVTVTSPTTAIADVKVSPTAALAPRAVRVTTPPQGTGQPETVQLPNAFAVAAATPPGASTTAVSTVAGQAGSADFADGAGAAARFRNLTAIAVGPDDAIYVADAGNHRVRVVREQANQHGAMEMMVSTLAGDGSPGYADGVGVAARFNNPQGVAVEPGGAVVVADSDNHRIRRVAADGTVTTIAGDGSPGFQNGPGAQARFNTPRGVAVDSHGNIYVADTGNAAVRVISPAGEVRTAAGDGTVGAGDSPAARFDGLAGVAADGERIYVYLADTGNHRIRRLDSADTVITIAGAGRGFADGTAGQARFAEPSGIAIDGSGKIVVADAVNSLVRQIDPELAASGSPAAVTTLAGTGDRSSADGSGDRARFYLPRGVAVARSSAVIVADTGNHTLRRILLPPSVSSITPSSARPLATVTISGERFDARAPERNTVSFTRSAAAGGGQTVARVTAVTRRTLTVVVPADVTTGPVTVQTDGGLSNSVEFVLAPAPAPSIGSFDPKRGPVGTTVTLSGAALRADTGETAVTFAGAGDLRLPALVSSASETEVRVTVPNGAATGVIRLTNAWGTAATAEPFTVEAQQDFQVTVAPATASAVQRASATYVVSLTSAQSSFTQLARLTAAGLPAGVRVGFEPQQLTAGANSTLTLNLADVNLAAGSYPFTISAAADIEGRETVRTAGTTLNVLPAGRTTLSGRVLNTDSEPIVGAIVSLDGKTATTDPSGSFLLFDVTAGQNRPVTIDGRTASSPNRSYPLITEPANIVAGQANVVPYIFYLPPIDVQYEVEVIPGQNTVAGNPRVPGLQMTIPAG